MKVILNADVPNLGEEGDIREVADGYARNFLLPRKLVLQYNSRNLDLLEERKEVLEQRREDKRTAAMGVKERLEAAPLVITMPAGENGRLFGSVTSASIASELEKQGIEIERKQVDIPEKTIKSVGNTRVRIRLYDNESAELVVAVQAAGGEKPKEAETAPVAEKKPEVEKPAVAEQRDVDESAEADESFAGDEYDTYDHYDDYDDEYDDEEEDDE